MLFQKNTGCSLKSVLFCLYAKNISKILSYKEVSIASVENGRGQHLHDPVNAFGLFWYLIPIRFSANKNTEKNCTKSDKFFAKLQKYIGYPFCSAMSFEFSQTCLASFNYTHFSHRKIKTKRLKIIKEKFYDRFQLPINLLCNFNKDMHELLLRIEYNNEIITDKQIQEIITDLCNSEGINHA